MKCEYFNCNRKARVNLFGLVWLCRRHAKEVVLEFKRHLDGVPGRPKKGGELNEKQS